MPRISSIFIKSIEEPEPVKQSLKFLPISLIFIFSLVKIIVLLISKPIFADPVSAWEIASPTIVSVLPTWPGYDNPGFGATPWDSARGTGIIVSSDGLILTAIACNFKSY